MVEENGSSIGLIAFGSTHWAVLEAQDLLQAQGLKTDYLRIRALPLHPSIENFLQTHDVIYVIEQNRDAQMLQILRSRFPKEAIKMESILHYDGSFIDADSIVKEITLLANTMCSVT